MVGQHQPRDKLLNMYVSEAGVLEVMPNSGTEKERTLEIQRSSTRYPIRVLDNLSRFPFLETLVISAGHKVQDIAPVGRLLALRSLDMPGNLISNLAPLEPCLLLQRLNVEDNQIVCVPGFFTGMIMLKSFLLANNRISGREVAGVLGNMPALTEVSLAGNPFMEDAAGYEEALTRLSRISVLDGQGVSRAERRAAADGCAMKRLANLESAIAEQAKRLEMIRGDHAKNASALDHVERAMTPQQPHSTRPPFSPPSSLDGSTQTSRNATSSSSPPPGRGPSMPWSPRAIMDRASSSSPAPDLSSYTVPTPARQHLRYGGGGGQAHDHAYPATESRGSPWNNSGSLRSSAAASGSLQDSRPSSGPRRLATRGAASPSHPSGGEAEPGGGGLRDAGVVARFLEEARPLLLRLGPPFSCAFPDQASLGASRSSEEVLVTLTALLPFLEERLEAWSRGGFGVVEGAEVEAAISEGYSRFRSIVGARAGGKGSISPPAAGEARLAHSPQEHRAIFALSPPVSGSKSAEKGEQARAVSGITTPPPGGVSRMSQQRPGVAAAGGGEKQADAAACRKKAGGGVPLEERFDHNSMYYPTVMERVGKSKVSGGGMKLHKLYGACDGPKPKAAQAHRIPFR